MAGTEPAVRLYCFAHAGAGDSVFHRWARSTGEGVEPVPVLLPGRGGRRREPRLTDRDSLVAHLLDRVRVPAGQSYALYGHSLGAMVAHALAGALREEGLPLPSFVAVGACPPPDAASRLSDACESSDEELVEALDRLGALPESVEARGYWRRASLPVLRDDLRLAGALRAAARASAPERGPLSVPLLAVSGSRDPLVSPATVGGWRRWTSGPVAARTVPGDHFFVRGEALPRLIGRACRVVRRLEAGTGAGNGRWPAETVPPYIREPAGHP
ncbi:MULTISPECIES: thioesterase II family protein [unclassified Streptomyces]|uniref:thioesterase II family protein n=1 Tax=unclassified Streptomyces TaxID=2593676 RepID=UPI0007C545AB|nr:MULTISPECIES: thioesterase domain-containing protein [unclassified Streptomyces]